MLDDLNAWWDTVELWVVELWFPLQFVVVMAVVVPVCLAVAWAVDRGVDHVAAWLRRVRRSRRAGRA
ncbi:MAG: hypothetical protein ACRDQF_03870 [Thermocrispum sp.]